MPGWSRMWVKAALGSPFTAFISESITGPLMTAARLRAPAPLELVTHKAVEKKGGEDQLVPAEGPGQSQLEECAWTKWKPAAS